MYAVRTLPEGYSKHKPLARNVVEQNMETENDGTFMTCGFCGNTTMFELVGEYALDGIDDYPCSSETYSTYALMKCRACRQPTLLEREKFFAEYEVFKPSDAVVGVTRIYPLRDGLWGYLSSDIAKVYNAAQKVRVVDPGAYAVLVGKTLEVVCKHEGAVGRTLALKLQDLANSGRIPEVLAQMGHQLRRLRNFGAHADDGDEVTTDDVPIITELVEAILEYLYVAPQKLVAVEQRLTKKSGETSAIDGSVGDVPF